jgi:hypothetical protein
LIADIIFITPLILADYYGSASQHGNYAATLMPPYAEASISLSGIRAISYLFTFAADCSHGMAASHYRRVYFRRCIFSCNG